MQREIKFRAWHSKANNWVMKCDIPKCFVEQTECVMFEAPSHIKLMQYTGMKDKNGKEIYEGDILKDGDIKYPYLREVYWDDRFQWSLRLLPNKQFSGSLSNDKYIIPEEMRNEIIGNIYEHPNLL